MDQVVDRAIEREYAQVSVEIMNLAGKYSNCRLKMMIGAIIGSLAAIMHLMAYFVPSDMFEDFPITFAFSYFFTLIGGVMLIIGIADYLGRGQYRRRIHEVRLTGGSLDGCRRGAGRTGKCRDQSRRLEGRQLRGSDSHENCGAARKTG
jgi:hypothetical protein